MREVDNKKLESISKEYPPILEQCTGKYPNPTFECDTVTEPDGALDAQALTDHRARNKRVRSTTLAPGARPVGRPRNASTISVDSNQSSILQFLRKSK